MCHLVVNVLVTSPLQKSQGSGGNVELGHLVLLDHVPVAGEVGVSRGTLEDHGRASEQQGRIHDVRVAGNPANVTTAEVAVIVVNIKDILAGHGSTQEVTSRGVHDTLGLSGGSRGVEQEERIFRVHRLRSKVVGVLLDLLVPPDITALGPGNLRAGALVDQDAGDIGALLQSLIDNALGANDLSSTLALIGRDDNLGASVQDTVPERVGGETGENNGVDGTDTRASQESDNGFGDHGKVDSNGVTLLHTLLAENPGNTRHLAQELTVGDCAALAGLIGLVDNGHLVGVLEGMAIDAVVGGVQTTLNEPGIVAILQRPTVGGLEVLVEVKQFAGHTSPESVWAADGLLMELPVLVKVFQVGTCRVLLVECFGDMEGVDFVGLDHLKPTGLARRPGDNSAKYARFLTTEDLGGITLPSAMFCVSQQKCVFELY